MVFLTKIRNLIKQYKNRNFRATVQKEKSKKYLFRDQKPHNTRGKWDIFKKNSDRTSPFFRFIQDKIQVTQDLRKKQELYLRYIGIFLIAACAYILIYSPYFQMSPSKILIEGLDDGIEVSLAYRSIEDLYGKNIFFVDEKEIANTLKKYQKNISLIQIDRLYPNGLKILLSGYPIIFDIQITTIKEKKWGMTENGILIPKENLEEIPLYSIEYIDPNLRNDEILDYKELLLESDAQTIKKTLYTFQEAWPDIAIQKVYYLKRENEMHLFLKNNTRILITLQDFREKTGEKKNYNNVRLQLLGLKAYIEKNRESFINGSYTYIDARISGKIFSCREKEICMKNLKFIYPDMSY